MSGETEKDVSGWTTDTLKEYVDRIFHEHEKAIVKALETHDKRVDAIAELLSGHMQMEIQHVRELMEERFRAETTAITKAEIANEKRFESVNEFRASLSDQTALFLTRNEYEAKHDALIQRIDTAEKMLDQGRGRLTGFSQSAAVIVGAVTVLGIVISTIIIVISR